MKQVGANGTQDLWRDGYGAIITKPPVKKFHRTVQELSLNSGDFLITSIVCASAHKARDSSRLYLPL